MCIQFLQQSPLLSLAVGGIIGGNAFDTLFTAASDIAYRDGSIYAHMDQDLLLYVLGIGRVVHGG